MLYDKCRKNCKKEIGFILLIQIFLHSLHGLSTSIVPGISHRNKKCVQHLKLYQKTARKKTTKNLESPASSPNKSSDFCQDIRYWKKVKL